MENNISVKHICLELKSTFEAFKTRFEQLAGHIDPAYGQGMQNDPEGTRKVIEALPAYQNLLIFNTQNHGALFNLLGKQRKAIQYNIGNPLIAIKMTQHDIRAALYAPLRVLLYEDENSVSWFTYDLPSTQFGQFGNEEVTPVAIDLDNKLAELVRKADSSESI